jgi:hypothetical protein
MEKKVIVEKVYNILSWFKQHNIGMDTGDERIVKLLGGYNIRYEAIDWDWHGNHIWMMWVYKDGDDFRDYVFRFEGKKLMKRWVETVVDHLVK